MQIPNYVKILSGNPKQLTRMINNMVDDWRNVLLRGIFIQGNTWTHPGRVYLAEKKIKAHEKEHALVINLC